MALHPATKAKQAAPARKATPKAAARKPGKPAPAAARPRTAAPKPPPKAARVGGPTTAAENVTLLTVFERIAAVQDLPKWQAHAMAAGLVDLVTSTLAGGGQVRMSGLGIIEAKDRPARMGRNPATGAAVQIAASKKVVFRPATALREAINA